MKTILLVEDDIDCQYIARFFSTTKGYRVITDCTGEDVHDILKAQRVHLILLDLKLGVADGLDICHEIKQYSKVPVVLFTASFVHKLDRGKCPPDAIIQKPFDVDEFEETVDALLGLNKQG